MSDIQSNVEERVSEALTRDERTKDLGIDVIDNNGVVTLKGHVPSEDHRRAAELVAELQPGVAQVINNLQILPVDEPGRLEDEDEPKLDQEDNPPFFPTKTG